MILYLVILVLVVLILLGLRHVRNTLALAIVVPKRMTVQDIQKKYEADDYCALFGIQLHELRITLRDGVELDAWFLPAEGATATIIVMHGINGAKETMLPRIAAYHRNGFNVLSFDARAHGRSGGEFCTLGYYEKYDVMQCIDYAEQHLCPGAVFAIHGASMGGAVALQTMAVEPRLRCAIAMCAFANLRETIYDYMAMFYHMNFPSLAGPVLRRAEQLVNFKIADVCPECTAPSIKQPVLLVHGDQDERIHIRYAHRNFARLGSTEKQLKIIPGAGHFTLSQLGGEDLEQTIMGWMRSHTTR